MNDDDSLVHERSSINEKNEMILREMTGGAIVVDLGWYPGLYEEQLQIEGEIGKPNREIFECQAMACDCMSEIGSIDNESVYERMTWNQDMADHPILLVPIEIHLVQGPTGNYPRFWGYICQHYPEDECWRVNKATISLPSGLSKRIASFSEDMMSLKADPLEDLKVRMILTTYHGLEEFEVNDEKRKTHKFWNTRIIEGHRSPD